MSKSFSILESFPYKSLTIRESGLKIFEKPKHQLEIDTLSVKGTVEQNILKGDSGGPLVVPENNFAFVYGIAGIGILPDDVSKENPPLVACFTRITSYLDWIQAKRAELDG